MLWVLLGTDRKKINSFIEREAMPALPDRPADGRQARANALQKLDAFSWDADLVRSSIETSSLFGEDSCVLVLEGISENEEASPLLMTFVETMAASSKKFFMIEDNLSEETIEFLESKGAKVSDFRERPAQGWTASGRKWKAKLSDGKFSPFALPDAVGKKSPKEAWIEYQRARMAGIEPEELHARVWAKVRDMISSESGTADELLIHPFVHKKAQADFRNWPPRLLQDFADELIDVYHQSRLGGDGLDVSMEKALLSI